MNEEIILTNNKMHVLIFKEPEILLYSLDKVSDVLDNKDSISIILSKFKFIESIQCLHLQSFIKKLKMKILNTIHRHIHYILTIQLRLIFTLKVMKEM